MVAGDIGPTGELFEPLGPLTIAEGAAAFAEQAHALAKGGADVIWIETMSSKDELTAAVEGAGGTGLPIVCTLTFDTNGRTMMGVTPAEVAILCREQLQPRPLAYGANCGVGPAELVATLASMASMFGPDDVIVAKGNCGVPHFVDDKIQYDGTPEQMAIYARLARDCGCAHHRRLLRHHARPSRRHPRRASKAISRARCRASRRSPPSSARSRPAPSTSSAAMARPRRARSMPPPRAAAPAAAARPKRPRPDPHESVSRRPNRRYCLPP